MNEFKEFRNAGFKTVEFNEPFLAEAEEASKVLSSFNYLINFFRNLGGTSINNGLFRIHTLGSSYMWLENVCKYFDKYKGKIWLFGFDWMGRQFAVSLLDRNQIYMLDPATGEDFEMEQSIEGFLNDDIVNYQEETFNKDFFNQVLIQKKQSLNFDQCFGFIKPLFLGGQDELNNYELADMDVYWEFNYQIFLKVKNLPPGTKINEIEIT